VGRTLLSDAFDLDFVDGVGVQSLTQSRARLKNQVKSSGQGLSALHCTYLAVKSFSFIIKLTA
jgi:hypothetical protein